jgi:VWFA-related protein
MDGSGVVLETQGSSRSGWFCRGVGMLVLTALGGGAGGYGQAPAPQPASTQQIAPVPGEPGAYGLKVTSQSVVLDVVVNDQQGANVKGLTKDDFEVYEDKVPQALNSFEEAAPTAVKTEVVPVNSTAELDRIEPDAPVSILVIDELTTKFEDLAFARYSLKKYLKAQGDRLEQPTMLVAANYRNIAVLRDYTRSRKEILDALEHHLADYAALSRARNLSWQGEQINATFGSLIGVAEATAGHHGHKNMIWIGRGFPPVNMATLLPAMQDAFNEQLATCTRLLRDSRVTLYAVDPAGIATQEPARDGADMYLDDPFGGQVDFDTMAVATGGKSLHGRNDVDRMIEESVRDGETFYTLAYRPAVKSDDPRAFRRIKVVMKDPALRASTREGYFVAAAPVAPVKDANGKFTPRLIFDMNVASGSLLVYDGVPLTVTREAAGSDRFELHLHAADLPLEVDASQKPSAELTVLTESFDRRGKMLEHNAKILTVRMLAGAPADAPDARSIQVPVNISTKAPAARIRFVVRANGSGKVGAENFFLVDKKTLSDPASGVDARRTYR